ncbi:MAG: hypothetical protein IJT19_09240 [Bacteroidaceae bacterium]|nr:hypothetical protein [Bacteroidaceae bacterium]
MKKIVMMMLVLASVSVKVNAQWFVGGTGGIGYFGDHFSLELAPQAGYEFNDRWAVGLGLGGNLSINEGLGGYAIIDPYVRFNCWNNGKLFVDVLAEADMRLNSDALVASVGLSPSLRYAFTDHWQAAVAVGLVGVHVGTDNDVDPYFAFTGRGLSLNVIYKF